MNVSESAMGASLASLALNGTTSATMGADHIGSLELSDSHRHDLKQQNPHSTKFLDLVLRTQITVDSSGAWRPIPELLL
jgi:hypothetical protein